MVFDVSIEFYEINTSIDFSIVLYELNTGIVVSIKWTQWNKSRSLLYSMKLPDSSSFFCTIVDDNGHRPSYGQLA